MNDACSTLGAACDSRGKVGLALWRRQAGQGLRSGVGREVDGVDEVAVAVPFPAGGRVGFPRDRFCRSAAGRKTKDSCYSRDELESADRAKPVLE